MLYLFLFFFLLEQCFVLTAFEHIIGSTNIWFKFCIKVTRVVGISKLQSFESIMLLRKLTHE